MKREVMTLAVLGLLAALVLLPRDDGGKRAAEAEAARMKDAAREAERQEEARLFGDPVTAASEISKRLRATLFVKGDTLIVRPRRPNDPTTGLPRGSTWQIECRRGLDIRFPQASELDEIRLTRVPLSGEQCAWLVPLVAEHLNAIVAAKP